MNLSMNGAPIAHVDLRCDCGGNPRCVEIARDGYIELSATFHGDHEQYWIVVKRDGKEVERFSVSSVDRIVWA